jgi:hypothetical protein
MNRMREPEMSVLGTKKQRKPNARRPSLQKPSLVKKFLEIGVGQKNKKTTAESLASDFQLIVPILIYKLGPAEINRLLKETKAEFSLPMFFPKQMGILVEWAKWELKEYHEMTHKRIK